MIRWLCHWLWGSSVRRQLVIGVALVHMLLMTIFVFDLVHRQREFLLGRAKSRVLLEAELLAANSVHGAMSNDMAALSEIINVLAQDKDVTRAMVTDGRGRVLAHTDTEKVGLFRSDPRTLAVLNGTPKSTLVDEERRSLEVAVPILAQNRVIGWTWVSRDLGTDQAHLSYVTHAGLVYTAAAILIGTTFAFLLAGIVTRQLRLLLSGTKRIAVNRLDEEVAVTTDNEVGQVTRAFNDAMHKLSEQQAALQRQADLLRLSFDAIIVWRLNGAIEGWNRGAERLYGYSESEALGRVTHELLKTVHSVPWPEIEARLWDSSNWEGELRHITKEGREVFVSARLQLIVGTDGVNRILETNRDITEGKQAEARLKSDISALTQMHELSGRILGEVGLQPLLQEAMNAAVTIMEADRGTLQLLEGDSLRIVAHHGHRQRFLEFFASAENRASVCGEAMLRGERVVVPDVEESSLFAGTPSLPVLREAGVRAVQSTPLVSHKGALLGILTTQWRVPYCPSEQDLWRIDLLARQAADLIEHARAEQGIAHLASFPELNPNPVFETDLDGQVIYANSAAQRLFPNLLQCGARHPLLADWTAVIAGFTTGSKEIIVRKVETGGRVFQQEIHCPRELKVVRAYFSDITECKRSEEALLRSEKLASVGRMAATIAHEINNPLAAVTNTLYLARTNADQPDALRQYLDTADEELRRIAYITRQALGFYRESNAPALMSVNGVLDSAVDLLKSKIKAKHAVIEKQWAKDVEVTAVAGELRQVFSNLLANSLDAIDEEGTIKLRVSTGPAFNNGHRCVRVTVADNGKGIDASLRQHLFEPFFTTKGTTGTGLGLWVSKQIIDKHGGTICMRSSSNGVRRGTVFSIILPVESAVVAHRQSAGV